MQAARTASLYLPSPASVLGGPDTVHLGTQTHLILATSLLRTPSVHRETGGHDYKFSPTRHLFPAPIICIVLVPHVDI